VAVWISVHRGSSVIIIPMGRSSGFEAVRHQRQRGQAGSRRGRNGAGHRRGQSHNRRLARARRRQILAIQNHHVDLRISDSRGTWQIHWGLNASHKDAFSGPPERRGGEIEQITTSEPVRAMLICAEAYAQTGSPADAEAAYRRVLALEPVLPKGVLGFSRFLFGSRRHDEVLSLLGTFLTAQPTHVEANVLLYDVLTALGRVDEAGGWLDAALARAPDNARLQSLRGEWLIRSGRSQEGVACLRSLLGSNSARPQVWLSLIREAESRDDVDEALQLAAKAVAACPGVFWLWSRQLLMLAARAAKPGLRLASMRVLRRISREGKTF
jgi:tetratricopeptide (TPR) repeat protein